MGTGSIFPGGGGVKKRQSLDFRSPEVGISDLGSACSLGGLGDRELFRSANILQIADISSVELSSVLAMFLQGNCLL